MSKTNDNDNDDDDNNKKKSQQERSHPHPPRIHVFNITQNNDNNDDNSSKDDDDHNDTTIDETNNTTTTKEKIISFFHDWLYTYLIGILVVSFWRGTWTLYDIYLCEQKPNATLIDGSSFCYLIEATSITNMIRYHNIWISFLIGYGLLCIGVGLAWNGKWFLAVVIEDEEKEEKDDNVHNDDNNMDTSRRKYYYISFSKMIYRFMILYTLGWGTVSIWRCYWYFADSFIFTSNIQLSMIFTMVFGFTMLFMIQCGASVLAPPSIFLVDGPGYSSPPIANTIIETYYSMVLPTNVYKHQAGDLYNHIIIQIPCFCYCFNGDKKKMHMIHFRNTSLMIVKVMNIFMTFFIVPILVVWFWRGCWGLFDIILWGMTESYNDLYLSLVYGTIIAIIGLYLGSTDFMYLFPQVKNKKVAGIIGRFRTLILAISTVSFWRVVWYTWDECLGRTTLWSAWLSHIIGVLGLLTMGCLSSIVAPPSTIGLDSMAHPDAVEEPLYHDIPIPAESLYLFGIGRKPIQDLQVEDIDQEGGGEGEHIRSRRYSLVSMASIRQSIPSDDFACLSSRNLEKREHSIMIHRSR